MLKTLEINRLLFDILNNKTDCNNRLYPLVAENGTSYPFMVYTRDNVSSDYCKDGVYEDNVDFTINIVSSTYSQGINIAQQVRELLNSQSRGSKGFIKNNDIVISDVKLIAASERFEEDAYIQTLQFTAKSN